LSSPRRHHYVPQFYLRGFAPFGSPGKITVFDKEAGTQFSTSVKNAAVQRDYYRLDAAEDLGEDPLLLENYLSEIEGYASSLTPRVAKGEDLQGEDRMKWAEFLASTYVRGPNARQMLADIHVRINLTGLEVATATKERYLATQKKMNKEIDEDKLDENYERFRDFLVNRKFSVSVSDQFTLRTFDMIEKLSNIFYDMDGSILHPEPKAFFVTSDTPVIYDSPPYTHDPFFGDGGL